ncbi:hypothetical protein [uncultured Porphyromonas sp.]|uniref:hypothetical protein n=1 Tax=uncultured Porphyromonas sp. TaxID=159274 RepID=UPI002621C40D|nr:hypothetical protein [uncultured Porphyromonas sp.]
MRKEQLIRICLAILLASTTLMLSSCKKDKEENKLTKKDPKEALVNTRWKTDMNIPGLDIDEKDRKTSGELYFTSPTYGEFTMAAEGVQYSLPMYYSYDATQKAYPATITLGGRVKQFIMKVNWDTNILLLYDQKDGAVSPKPVMGFRLVK